jgi:MoaA/NifB/PqqE/SkfB family radical SAM enzyme
MKKDAQLNVFNAALMRREPPAEFEFLRVDSNNDCNVHCVYCHNPRSKELIPTDELSEFFDENVLSVDHFQLGCVMEPTLDRRLCAVLTLAANSRARPSRSFLLQTNGILLHRHDYAQMRAAGLTDLSVSIDAADPATHKALRGGTSMAKVRRTLADFHRACPAVAITFMATVTTLNVSEMENLVAFGLDVGAKSFVFREVLYEPGNPIVDNTRMPGLVLHGDQFARMKDRVLGSYGDRATFLFADAPTLEGRVKVIREHSKR